MVRDNECSSYPGFESSEVFMRKYRGRFKGPKKIVPDNKFRVIQCSSYREFTVIMKNASFFINTSLLWSIFFYRI